ncbi:VIT1/CCC1 transporter family protein [Candidatus Protochlamydia phocaeensis]|uniref:VIT1/CCC1 transporter family protein n=1 Tax=Candidatus Protochlamydia phocaeensis TaxID=1414722 RepID=UPI0008392196|nr:VIT1/CCC1 transporter family protein [Candidatus Protochlamydia phocaeensis]
MASSTDHFKGKSAVAHIIEAQARGLIAASEIHGTEIPGSLSAGMDAARETVIVLLLLNLLAAEWIGTVPLLNLWLIFLFGWLIWKTGRSAWLGWSRLERLHRILEEERWEIEHNREQEREELRILYAAKGFEGQLLEDVLDVLMADGDRLLKVMVEEELGLSLEAYEHPLKQGLGAAIGVSAAALLSLAGFWLWPAGGLYAMAVLILSLSASLSAHYQGNRLIPSIVWNIGLTFLAGGAAYFLLHYFLNQGWLS